MRNRFFTKEHGGFNSNDIIPSILLALSLLSMFSSLFSFRVHARVDRNSH